MILSMRNDRRRDGGGKRSNDGLGLKNTLYVAGIILTLGIIAFFVTVMIYNNSLDKIYTDLGSTEVGKTGNDESTSGGVQEASSQVGKSVEELENEIKEANTENEETKETNSDEVNADNEENTTVASNKSEEKDAESSEKEANEEPASDPVFEKPVEGEQMKEFAKDKLVYSETLKEWVVHTGVDIKADKTTVVKASEEGTVTAIKNDPRYGITVIIEHNNGYETRYANLLTAEFVSVGEKVTKGQTIGTVGNTSTFEILDEAHLHFEILKDGQYQDPNLYVEF